MRFLVSIDLSESKITMHKKLTIHFLICFFFTSLSAQQIENKHYLVSNFFEGLSNVSIICILEDSKEYIWAGTENGLNRFNGDSFKIYSTDTNDSSSLNNSFILCLYEVNENEIWIGTNGGGINIYNREFDNFSSFSKTEDKFDLSNTNVLDLLEDRKGQIWAATNQGVFVIDKESKEIINRFLSGTYIKNISEDVNGNIWIGGSKLFLYDMSRDRLIDSSDPSYFAVSFPQAKVRGIVNDKNGSVWIATLGNGLWEVEINPEGKYFFQSYLKDKSKGDQYLKELILNLFSSSDGLLWIGVENGGLYKFHPDSKQVERYPLIDPTKKPSSNKSIWSINEDHAGRIWTGAYINGLNVIDPYLKDFGHVSQFAMDFEASMVVEGVSELSNGDLCLATDGFGFHLYNKEKEESISFLHDPNNKNSLSSNAIVSMKVDEQENLYFTTWGGGISIYDLSTDLFQTIMHDPNDPSSLSGNRAMDLAFDPKAPGNYWVGIWQEKLDYYNSKTGKFSHIGSEERDDDIYITYSGIVDVEYDHDGNLWVATAYGLNKIEFDESNEISSVRRYYNAEDDSTSISHNYINTVYIDIEGRVWIGTVEGGLNLYQKETDDFVSIDKTDGLGGNSCLSMVEDDQGNLWVATTRGISKCRPIFKGNKLIKMDIVNYDQSDGLVGDFFRRGAAIKTKNGELIFGNSIGFELFQPESIKKNLNVPPVYITDLKLFNKSIDIRNEEQKILTKDVSSTKEIFLDHSQNIITFEYIAINYTKSNKNQYAYMMEGVDKDWNYVQNSKSATYTTLSPGKYVFKVKASNNDGIWNEEGASIIVNVIPPFWQTAWFIFMMILLVIILIIIIIKIKTNSMMKDNRVLEDRVRDRTEELIAAKSKAEEASLAKSNFLANMSHEIRTPMNGMIGMTELALEASESMQQRHYLQIVKQSGESLVSIINDILDFSKIEAGKLVIEKSTFNLIELINNVSQSFAVSAVEKDIEILVAIDKNVPVNVSTDPVRLRQVLMNLIGNSVKFTSAGEIIVRVKNLSKQNSDLLAGDELILEISVADTGIGIEASKANVVFESFSQADTSITRKFGGTGLGLTICENLVKLMGGEIVLKSILGEGSTFSFTLPIVTPDGLIEEELNGVINLRGKKVLILDSNESSRKLMKELMSRWGVIAESFADVNEVLKIFDDEKVDYDLVLIDHYVDGKIGTDIAHEILQNHLLKVIILDPISNLTNESDYGKNGSMISYLKKPIDIKRLKLQLGYAIGGLEHVIEKNSSDSEKSSNLVYDDLEVLLAEDNEINRMVFTRLVGKKFPKLTIAKDGKEALETLGKKKYDLVFMDVQMPYLDGLEVTRKTRVLSSVNKETPIIALTAYAMQSDRNECLEAGMNAHLSKPIDKTTLFKLIEEYCG